MAPRLSGLMLCSETMPKTPPTHLQSMKEGCFRPNLRSPDQFGGVPIDFV